MASVMRQRYSSKGRRAAGHRSRAALRELERTPTQRYVDLLREEGLLLSLGDLDIDLGELVDRHFACDSKKCLGRGSGRTQLKMSCCARYRIELTSLDRERLLEMLPVVRRRLPKDHPLQDPAVIPWVTDEEYRRVMCDDESGMCPFLVYEQGRGLCAIHDACVREGLDPWEHKPIACSLWPVATIEYVASTGLRTLITAYGEKTAGLFADEDEYTKLKCLLDTSESLPRLYESHRDILARLFGARLVQALDRVARERS